MSGLSRERYIELGRAFVYLGTRRRVYTDEELGAIWDEHLELECCFHGLPSDCVCSCHGDAP